jgi:ABC-2 type transport system permease protein
MISAIKSEFRKLLTIRSTYVICLLSFALLVFFAFYIGGLRAGAASNDPGKLTSDVMGAINFLSIFIAIASALIMTHEYRYNTILYTLTASKSRLRVLLAKVIVVSVFSIVFTLVAGTLSPILSYMGMSLHHLTVVHQNIQISDLLWRGIFYGWAYGMIGLLFATLIRSQIGTMVAIFFIPSTIEPLLGLLLKEKVAYLPFNALNAIAGNLTVLTHAKAAVLVTVYLLAGWIIAFVLFLRRDAN